MTSLEKIQKSVLFRLGVYFCLLFYSLVLSSHAYYAPIILVHRDKFYACACSEWRPTCTCNYNFLTRRSFEASLLFSLV